ncbi:MAG: hypothetical protein N2Z70_02430 [Bdellovibrionaceae bacterium]|nr:hypothetical protein [Pseudobdellovibrionaceae bacterium]
MNKATWQGTLTVTSFDKPNKLSQFETPSQLRWEKFASEFILEKVYEHTTTTVHIGTIAFFLAA